MIRQIVRMLCAGIIHGDLSEYNVLVDRDGPVIIDLPQAVDAAGNNNARAMLQRDVDNITTYFARFAPALAPTQYGKEIWALYERGVLREDSPLTGRRRRRDAHGRRARASCARSATSRPSTRRGCATRRRWRRRMIVAGLQSDSFTTKARRTRREFPCPARSRGPALSRCPAPPSPRLRIFAFLRVLRALRGSRSCPNGLDQPSPRIEGTLTMHVRHPERHRTDRIGWLRAAVLGANDGIVSTASLVVGVAAAHAPARRQRAGRGRRRPGRRRDVDGRRRVRLGPARRPTPSRPTSRASARSSQPTTRGRAPGADGDLRRPRPRRLRSRSRWPSS